MRMPVAPIALGAALAFAGPLHARTIEVTAGPGAAQNLQEALILAEPGDVVQIGPGRIVLSDGLSLDVDGVTVRGAGPNATVLDFHDQQGAGEGLLVTSDDVTLADFAVVDTRGDGIKSKGADRIVYQRVRVEWTGGPKETNGAYGIYPVESSGVLVEESTVSGASDAGIYVGQSRDITVRYNHVFGNVAGIEIENSRNALVTANFVHANTGGILVFDLPNLPVMGGGNTLIIDNIVTRNNQPNFAPKGNIVASVRRGTGVMIMANDGVEVTGNKLDGNLTSQVMVIAYPLAFTDERYNPFPRRVVIGPNRLGDGATDPQLPGKEQLLAAFGGALPPVLWDGLGDNALSVDPGMAGWSLNLKRQGDSADTAQPGPLAAPAPGAGIDRATVGAPAAMEARISP